MPVADIDRAQAFYADQLGFVVDHDLVISDDVRIVQLTPPGWGCSIVVGKGTVPYMPPGSLNGRQLVVPDIHRAHQELRRRGERRPEAGREARGRGRPVRQCRLCVLCDPDGNEWAVQQISSRA